jgi:hypothetical protein
MANFDVIGAKKAGYSDAEIADHLSEANKFDSASARKEGYSDQEIIKHLNPVSKFDVLKGGASGLISGIAGIAGQGGDLERQVRGTVLNSALNLGNAGANLLRRPSITPQAMQNIQAVSNKAPTIMPSSQPVVQDTQRMFGSPQTTGGKYAQSIASMAPAVLGGGGGIITRGLRAIVPGVTSEAAGQMTEGTKYERPARIAGALIGGAGIGAVEGLGARMAADKRLQTTAQDRSAASNLYEQMKQEGVVVSKQRFDKFKNDLKEKFKKSGTEYKLADQSKESIDLILSKKGTIDFDELDLLRRTASRPFQIGSSASSTDKNVAGDLVRSIDDFIQTLNSGTTGKAASLLKEGQRLWAKQAKSGMIEKEIEKAKASAGTMNVKLDDALRARFNKLSNDEKRMGQFTPEEQTAIKKVAKGGLVPDSLSVIGKLAPTSWASIIFNAAAMGGGYGAGQKLALAFPAVGTAAKIVSTPLTLARALEASKTVRRGGPPASVNPQAKQAGAIAAYLANQQGQTQ